MMKSTVADVIDAAHALPKECEACAAKPGSPELCTLCLALRHLRSKLSALTTHKRLHCGVLGCSGDCAHRRAHDEPISFADLPCAECGLTAAEHPTDGNAGVERCKVRALMRELNARGKPPCSPSPSSDPSSPLSSVASQPPSLTTTSNAVDRLASTAARMLILHHRLTAERQGHYGLGYGLGGGSYLWEELEQDLNELRRDTRRR
jgi:hypothetical protein